MALQLTVTPQQSAEPQPPFQGAPSFEKRRIQITIKLGSDTKTNQPNKFENGSDTLTVDGARTSVRIQNSGAPAGSSASVDIFGLTQSLTNQFCTLGMSFNLVPKNTMLISAGVDGGVLSPVFTGTITNSYADYNQAPNVPMHFELQAGLFDSVMPTVASSFPGSTAVADIMAGFARIGFYAFENNGVTVKLQSPYFSGSLATQIQECAEAAGINAEVIGSTLVIWPRGGSRDNQSIPLISKDTGMVGYPAYTQQGIIVRSIFNPQITFGGKVKVESSVLKATGTWAVNKLDLALDALIPRGQWMSTAYCYNPAQPPVLPPWAGQ